jgi:nicotinamidase/pyrazinamidase
MTSNKRAALVVDIQGDFTEWKHGSLAVPGTDEDFVRQVAQATVRLKDAGLVIFGSQDWHPPNHMSFASNHPGRKPMEIITIDGRTQVLWPDHCVQGTEDARVLVDNNLFLAIVRKGQDPAFESYSVFRDDGGRSTELETMLIKNGIGRLALFGLATDYCVRASAVDALSLGYKVTVVEGLCRGIEEATTAVALRSIREHGAKIVRSIDDLDIEDLQNHK